MGVKVRQKDGKWYVFINHQGKRKAKCIGDSKKAALEVKRKLEAKLTLGDFDLLDSKEKILTFGEYAEKWLLPYAEPNCKESTYVRYAGIVRNHLIPTFGTIPINEITREAIKELLASKRKTLTESSVQNILIPLREMLNHAVEDRLLPGNPATRAGRFLQKRHDPEKEIDPLSARPFR